MHILQSGYPKSGNVWLFRTMTHILNQAGIEQRSYIAKQPIAKLAQSWPPPLPEQSVTDTINIQGSHWYYGIGKTFQMPIQDIDAYIAQTSQVWTHALFTQRNVANLSKFSHITYVIRDPRAGLNSYAHFVFSPHMRWHHPNVFKTTHEFVEHHMYTYTRQWVRHVAHALKLSRHLNIHFVFYENLVQNFDTELDRLLAFLSIELDELSKAAIRKATSFETMKQAQPNHLRRGMANSWSQELLPHQQREISTITGRLCEYLGYPRQPIGEAYPHLSIPSPLRNRSIEAAILHSTHPTWRERRRHYSRVIKSYYV